MESVLTYTKIVNLPIVAMPTGCCWGPHRTKLRLPIPGQPALSTIPPKDQPSALTLPVSPLSSASQPEWIRQATQGQPIHELAYGLMGKDELA